jgi:hypothetical protein
LPPKAVPEVVKELNKKQDLSFKMFYNEDEEQYRS